VAEGQGPDQEGQCQEAASRPSLIRNKRF
jgi:hypothetical protein